MWGNSEVARYTGKGRHSCREKSLLIKALKPVLGLEGYWDSKGIGHNKWEVEVEGNPGQSRKDL